MIPDPVPDWMQSLKPENASVLDPSWLKIARTLSQALGLTDPQSQVLGIMAPLEVPGGRVSTLAELLGLAKRENLYLHGSSHDFKSFRPGPHQAIYLSPSNTGRTSQAEHIASGPFGGKLYAVRINDAKLKKFDPLNDPVAKQILESVASKSNNHQTNIGWIHYSDMPDIVRAAAPHGYNDFTVWEPSVQGHSRAVTDPAALEIVGRVDARE